MADNSAKSKGALVIGVDVGGTNTDSVLLELTKPGASAVISWDKSPTTPDVTDGVETTLGTLLSKPITTTSSSEGEPSSIPDPSTITALAIGTTHFLNAIIQRDAKLLSRVAVIRLGSHNFLDGALPFADWPADLRHLIEGYSAIVPGGVNIDGRLVAELDHEALRAEARKIHASGLRHVVVVGMGSPMDRNFNQEAAARDILLAEIEAIDPSYAGGVAFVLSHSVAGSGILARENASILNAAIFTFARRTVRSFQRAMSKAGLRCPLYLTSNAGHLLPFSEALNFPIRIFSSGATNSMRGAAFLAREELQAARQGSDGGSVVVVDVGGTTSDVGVLLPNGYPRLSQTFTELAGVRINLDMASVESIGLGGGSIVRTLHESASSTSVSVGPDSVGYALLSKALCFGGDIPTATDIAVAATDSPALSIGNPSLIKLSPDVVASAQLRIKKMFETLIDRIKQSAEDSTMILVGGGAILCPSELKGVSKIIRSEHAGVANAIGAALAKIYGSAEAFVDADEVKAGTRTVTEAAIAAAVAKGGDPTKDVTTLNETVQWVPYVDGKRLIRVEVACDADHRKVYDQMLQAGSGAEVALTDADEVPNKDDTQTTTTSSSKPASESNHDEPANLSTYEPEILPSGEWLVSPTDLKFLEIGCYILGCGGGGSPYATYLALLESLRNGERILIASPASLPDDAVLPSIAAIGTPAVSLERINSEAVYHAIQRLSEHSGWKPTALLSCEIGGMNGLATLKWASQRYCDVPAVDGDLMGRAYPQFEMVSPYVHEDAVSINELLPVSITSGDGRDEIVPAGQTDETTAGKEIRRICTEYGFAAGAAGVPLSGAQFRRKGIPNTMSLAWRLGRVVRRAQVENTLGKVTDAIVDEVGGPASARTVFTGKIRSVETRITDTGHSLGEAIIERLDDDETESGGAAASGTEWTQVRVPFMNENLAVVASGKDGEETVLATVPDLICLLDVSTGEAIGTQEYRYGVKVSILVMAPHPIWTTPRALSIAGPKAFQVPYEYEPTLRYNEPRSVLEEFAPVKEVPRAA